MPSSKGFMTLTNVNFSDDVLKAKTAEIRALYPSKVSVYEPASLWEQDEDIRSLSSTLLFGGERRRRLYPPLPCSGLSGGIFEPRHCKT